MVLAKQRASRSKKTAKSLVKAHNVARKIVTSRQGNGTWSHKLPTKDEVKANGRTKGRNLVQWFNPGKAEQALLAIVYECHVAGIKLPFDNIAHRMNPGSSGESFKQHLPKLREELLEQGFAVPPRITKRRDDQTGIRVCVRDDTHTDRERKIGWSEVVDEPKDLLHCGTPRSVDLNNADGFSMHEENQQSEIDPEGDFRIEDGSGNSGMESMEMLAQFHLVPEPEAKTDNQGIVPPGDAADNSLSEIQMAQDQLPFHVNFEDVTNIEEEVTRFLANHDFANVEQENRTESSPESSLELELAPWDPALLLPDNGGGDFSLYNPMAGEASDVLLAHGISGNEGWGADTVNPLDTILPNDAEFGAIPGSLDDLMADTTSGFVFPIGLSETNDKFLPTQAEFPDFTMSLEPLSLSATTGGLELLEQYLQGSSEQEK